ncbi:hypothetical protein FRC02_005884 [Tulasnella sp. 418]|nr:hypothetical protein FRC02_005884 [Tulasnella sp. 418]
MMSGSLPFHPAANHMMLQERQGARPIEQFDQRRIQPQPTSSNPQPVTSQPQRQLFHHQQQQPAAASIAQTLGMGNMPVQHQQQLLHLQQLQKNQQQQRIQPNPMPNRQSTIGVQPIGVQPPSFRPPSQPSPYNNQIPPRPPSASMTNQNQYLSQQQQPPRPPSQQQSQQPNQFSAMNSMAIMASTVPVSGLPIDARQLHPQHPSTLNLANQSTNPNGPSNFIATPSQQAQRVESYASHQPPGGPNPQQQSAPSQQQMGGPPNFPFGANPSAGPNQLQDRMSIMNPQSSHPAFGPAGLGISAPGSSAGGPINMQGIPSNQPGQSQQQAMRGMQGAPMGGSVVLGSGMSGIGPGPQNHASPRHLQQHPQAPHVGPQPTNLGRPPSQPMQQQPPFPHSTPQPTVPHQPPALISQHQSQMPQGSHHQPVLPSSIHPSTPNMPHQPPQQHPPPAQAPTPRAGSVTAHTPRNMSQPPQTPQLVQSQPPVGPGFNGQPRLNRQQTRSASLGLGPNQLSHPHGVGAPPPSGLPQQQPGDPLSQGASMGNMLLGQFNPAAQNRSSSIGSGQGVIRLMEFSHALAQGGGRDLSYWKSVTSEYFVPDKGCMRLTLWKDEAEAKPFEIYSPTMPRFFLSYFNSGVHSISISMNGARETLSNVGESLVECTFASFTYSFENGYVVVHTGPLRAHVLVVPVDPQSMDALGNAPNYHLKFIFVEFSAKKVVKQIHVDCIRSLSAPTRRPQSPQSGTIQSSPTMMTNGIESNQNLSMTGLPMSSPGSSSSPHNNQGAGNSVPAGTILDGSLIVVDKVTMPLDPVNGFGIPQGTMRCLELAESVSSMTDLIRMAVTNDLGPVESLRRFADGVRREHPDEPWAKDNPVGPFHQQPQGRIAKNEPYSPGQFHPGVSMPGVGMMPPYPPSHLGPGTPHMIYHASALMPQHNFHDGTSLNKNRT